MRKTCDVRVNQLRLIIGHSEFLLVTFVLLLTPCSRGPSAHVNSAQFPSGMCTIVVI
jgi:hypothetical protein